MVNPYGQPDRKKTVFFLVKEDLRKSSGDFIRDDLSYFSWLILLVKLRTNFSREERMKRKVNFFFQSFCTSSNVGKWITIYNAFKLWNQSSLKYCFIYQLYYRSKPFFVASKVLECLKFWKSFNCALRYLESLHFNQFFSTFQIDYK